VPGKRARARRGEHAKRRDTVSRPHLWSDNSLTFDLLGLALSLGVIVGSINWGTVRRTLGLTIFELADWLLIMLLVVGCWLC
jgi:hypothetical protein